MERVKQSARKELEGRLPEDPWLVGKCPKLTEFLVDCKYDDGTVRQPSTLTVFVEAGVLKVALNDRDAEQTLYRSGTLLSDAMEALEAALCGHDADWRPWRKKGIKK